MLARNETIATIVANWLAQFERALAEPDDVLLKTLFHSESHWRDVLALTWHIRTVSGLDVILRELKGHVARANPTGFRIDPDRTAPRLVTRAGTDAIDPGLHGVLVPSEPVDGELGPPAVVIGSGERDFGSTFESPSGMTRSNDQAKRLREQTVAI